MKFDEVYRTLEKNNYYIFSIDDLSLFYPHEKRSNLKKLVYRWKKRGLIQSLKRGLYELIYPSEFNIPDVYIANKLYSPSYVSLETALSHYSIIPEVSMAVTSITTKATRRFKNKHGFFVYHTVNTRVFTGYQIEENQGFEILIAEPEKALVDYLYFRFHRPKRTFSFRDERLELDIIKKFNMKKVKKYANLYNLSIGELDAFI
jgi:predicted transcriptional regulator of viral defense system